MNQNRSILRSVGALWVASLLLVLLLVAMAFATVFESTSGTEQALLGFYQSWWFELILGLLVVSVLAAVAVRFPLARNHTGFAITHAALFLILIGALVTRYWGLDGRVSLVEGQSTDRFLIPEDTLTILDRQTGATAGESLAKAGVGRLELLDEIDAPELNMGGVRLRVTRFLPDSEMTRTVVENAPQGRPAVRVSLSADGRDTPVWLFENHDTSLGTLTAKFRRAASAGQLAEWLGSDEPPTEEKPSFVRIEISGADFEIPLEDCMNSEVPVGETGYRVRVLQYLPHASVGQDNKLVTLSNQPVNPAIEAEIIGPEGSQTRLAFSRFPDFSSMHGDKTGDDLKLTFVAPDGVAHDQNRSLLEVIESPEGKLMARFAQLGGPPVVTELTIGDSVETPWPDREFTVLGRSERAALEWQCQPVQPVRKERTPAVLVQVSADEHTSRLWLQKHRPQPLTINGNPYEIAYGDRSEPLGFKLTLDRFRIGYYPGEKRPRSFESQITVSDPAVGGTQSRVTSMNNPAKYGGFTIFQSSYSQEGGTNRSVLSVSRDPGRLIVFTGYVTMLLGMLIVLFNRIRDHRRSPQPAQAQSIHAISLGHCASGVSELHPAQVHGNGRAGRRRKKGHRALSRPARQSP